MTGIGSIYRDMQLFEMAARISRTIDPMGSEAMYNVYRDALHSMPKVMQLGDVTVHGFNGVGKSAYVSAVDGNPVHVSSISYHNSSIAGIPSYQKQDVVQQNSEYSGLARHVILHHIANSSRPLRSDIEQTDAGHAMWRKLVPDAIDRGLHVYHYDGEKLHPTTKENMGDHLNSYFGDLGTHLNQHMFISRDEIK